MYDVDIYRFASVEIVVPPAGNCGDDTVLTCVVEDASSKFTGWFGLGRDLMNNGAAVHPEDSKKYTQAVNGSSFSLIIKDTDIHDQGKYKCRVGFSESQLKMLIIECKAKYVNLILTRDRHLIVILKSVYPRPQIKLNIFEEDGTKTVLKGSFRKQCSSLQDWLLTCEWTSSNAVQDGNYSYSATVTTVTTSIYNGYFKISIPNTIRLDPSTESYHVEEYSEINNVTCTVYCNPECQYVWRDGHGNNISTSSVLALGKVDRSLQGEYVCNAWNWFGKVNDTVFVTVLYGPESIVFTPSSTTYVKNEGEMIENIQCSVVCNPNCTVEWFQAERIEETVVSNSGYLGFGSVKRQDAGVYKCVATNTDIQGDPSIQKSLELEVRYGPDTVKLSSGSDVTLILGEISQDITCSSECNPPCFFTWSHVNSTILSNDSILSLGKVEFTVQGEYRCTVSNDATGKTIYTTLTVVVENPEQTQEGTTSGAIIGGVVGMVVLLGLIATLAFLCYKRKQHETLKTKDTGKNTSQCDVSQQENRTTDTAYVDLKERGESKKEDVYDELTVSVTDVSASYENASVHGY
ncbi:carcinoembryonic antigen-related cell adhesion molecule 20-like [Mercenaria mercenaria]|uniref:carcinoembryonic antigen-related cell adhesion molecule 20-like n=1 Tax=Mercenaria mercenaria TaxID=6596 RepID=UPI00234E738F|nr:carcinoembryonic antigen-related cell adhesion molecule 20-like [Mercenaria mercenaria]